MFCTRKSHCAVGPFYFKTKLIEKEIRFVVIRGRGWGEVSGRRQSKSTNFQL